MTSGSRPGTATSATGGRAALARSVRCDDERFYVTLVDGREINAPLTDRLRAATREQRGNGRVQDFGTALRWDEIDEDLSVAILLGVSEAVLETLAGLGPADT
ncbi:MAG TPA: DUF2442 domain-containing protein [Candidatus Limnocylindria bacterium]